VPAGVQVVQVDASEDVWGELERLLYGTETEKTPPASPLVDALRDSSLGAPLGLVRPNSAHGNAAGEDGSIISADVVPELKLEKGSFCLMSNGGAEEVKMAQTGDGGATFDNKGRNKRRGFIILDTEAASPSRHERRESLALSDQEALDLLLDEAQVAAGRAKDEQTATSLLKDSGTQQPVELIRETLPVTPEGAKHTHWDGWGPSMDPSMDDRASVASTAEVGDHGMHSFSSGVAGHDTVAAVCAPVASPALRSPGGGAQEDSVPMLAQLQAGAPRNTASWHSISSARAADLGVAQVAAIRSESVPRAQIGDSRRKSLDLRRPRKFDVSDVETSSDADAVSASDQDVQTLASTHSAPPADEEEDHKKEMEDQITACLDANPDDINDIEELRTAGVSLDIERERERKGGRQREGGVDIPGLRAARVRERMRERERERERE